MSAINDKQDAPETAGTEGQVLALALINNELVPVWITPAGGSVSDVQINGTSILSQGVANIPVAGTSALGAVKYNSARGIEVGSDGVLQTRPPSDNDVKDGANQNKPIVPSIQHRTVFYGLAKAAGDTSQSASSNAVGNYTDEAKSKIQKMLGLGGEWTKVADDTLTEDTTNYYIDFNGQHYKELAIEITNLQTTSSNNSMKMYFQYNENRTGAEISSLWSSASPIQPTSTNYKTSARIKLKVDENGWLDGVASMANNAGNVNGTGALLWSMTLSATPYLSSLNIFLGSASTNKIASGTKIIVYAR